jgi:Fe-S cluster assembly iron-binding protein IscA
MLTMTDQAVDAISGIIADAELGPDAGLRISASNEVNGDTALEFELTDTAREGDEVLRDGDAVVFLDEAAAVVLADMTLDVHSHGDHFHFSLDAASEDGG